MRALLLVVVLAAGCSAHVAVRAPPPENASLAERAAAYEALRPASLARSTRGGEQLVLADGTVVADPRDLAPALTPDARTLVHADNARALDDAALWLRAGGTVALTASLATMLYGMALVSGGDDTGHLWVSGASLAGSALGLATMVPQMALSAEAERERVAAFYAYPGDLRARLALQRKRDVTAYWQGATPRASDAPPEPLAPGG